MNTRLFFRIAAPWFALVLAASGCSMSDTCESSAICGSGEVCFAGSCVAALPAGSCTPPTTGTLVNGGATASTPPTCTVGTPSTYPQPVDSSLPSEWLLPLTVDGSPVAAPVTATVGSTVSFAVPQGTSSLSIHHQGVSAALTFSYPGYGSVSNSVVPTALTTPNGTVIYVDDLEANLLAQPYLQTGYYGGLTPWTGSYTFPGTSRVLDLSLSGGQVPPGTWSVEVNDWNAECAAIRGCTAGTAGSYRIDVVARPGPYVSTGTLNVGIYLATRSGVTAASAIADPRYQRFVWAIGQFLGRAGICLGTVTFFNAPNTAPWYQPDISGDPPCGDLARLFSIAEPSVNGVHLFLVDDICVGTSCGTNIVGIDGSIPGPSGFPGAVTSGAAMIIDDINANTCTSGGLDLSCGSDVSAYIAAHEIGHWLGLYHTTESFGELFDPIDDTSTCACTDCASSSERPYCASFSAQVDAARCVSGGKCGGGDNLMFWQVDPSVSVGNLSAEQANVIRNNAAVQ